ncbi:tripartite tricarboxylate transporter TctB family protein [Alkalispirochaeta americana]|nr:tripartite tricarboxylate transporter TctB family protein [Alkalispirochaeta americana]
MQMVFLGIVLALGWLLIRPFKKLRPYTGQILVLASILWIGLLFYVITFSFPVPRFSGVATTGATVPRFWFYVLIPVSFLAFIPMLKGEEVPDKDRGNLWRLGIVFGVLVLSLVSFRYIGYYLSSAIFLVVVMWVLDSRNKIELIAVPVCWVIFSYFFFARLLYVRLPVGALFTGLFG